MTPPQVTELSKGPAVERLERDRLKVMRVDVGLERRTLEQQMAEPWVRRLGHRYGWHLWVRAIKA